MTKSSTSAPCRDTGRVVRFIEYMPLDAEGHERRDQVVASEEILAGVGARWPLERVDTPGDPAPAERFRFVDGRGEIGVVASVTRPFFGTCNRLRLTTDGAIRNRLFSDDEVSVRTALRNGGSDGDLAMALRRAVWGKLPGHGINDPGFLAPGPLDVDDRRVKVPLQSRLPRPGPRNDTVPDARADDVLAVARNRSDDEFTRVAEPGVSGDDDEVALFLSKSREQCYLARPRPWGGGQGNIRSPRQPAGHAEVIHKGAALLDARLGVGWVGLEPPVVEEVSHLQAPQEHGGIGNEPAVTAPPHRLRAHHRHVALTGVGHELVQGVEERPGRHVVGIGLEREVPPRHVGRVGLRFAPAAERRPPLVAQAVGRDRVGHGLSGEVREAATARERAHVDDARDPGLGHQSSELSDLEGAMADGVQHSHQATNARPPGHAGLPASSGTTERALWCNRRWRAGCLVPLASVWRSSGSVHTVDDGVKRTP